MGTAASSNKHVSPPDGIISPRIQMTKKGHKDAVLDSLPLTDVGSGTIHYRHKIPELYVNTDPDPLFGNTYIHTGYFYHPKLKDYSEFGDPVNEETYKFIRVAEGPRRLRDQDICYVSGIGFHGDAKLMPSSLMAVGPGLTQSKKKIYGHKYFLLSLEGDAENIVPMEAEAIWEEKGGILRAKQSHSATLKDVKTSLGQHFLCPASIIHFKKTLDMEIELSNEQTLEEHFPAVVADELTLILTPF